MALQQQPAPTVENHFIAGLKTEYTGLNFPENATTDTQNCVYSLIGDVTRRGGINLEANFVVQGINTSNVARSSFKWYNAGGDGSTQLLVQQIGNILYFYRSSSATIANPLSTTLLPSSININGFQSAGNTADISQTECQYATGNGYLFVFHPNCDSFFCTYSNGLVTGTAVSIQTRDFIGINEPGVPDNLRPKTLSDEHLYNLLNQGWTQGSAWTASGTGDGSGNIPISGLYTLHISSQVNTTSVTNGSVISVNIPFAAKTGSNNNN